MKLFTYIFAIILILFGISFALLNAKLVTLNYYVGTVDLSLSLLLALTVGVGIIIGFFVALAKIFKLRHKIYQLKHRVKQLEQEVATNRVTAMKEYT